MNNFEQGLIVELEDGLKYYIIDSVTVENNTFLQLAEVINDEQELGSEIFFTKVNYIDDHYTLTKISNDDMIKYGLINLEK